MKRKILTLLMATYMVSFSLLGCGNSSSDSAKINATVENEEVSFNEDQIIEDQVEETEPIETEESGNTLATIDTFEAIDDLDSFTYDMEMAEDTKHVHLSDITDSSVHYIELVHKTAGVDEDADVDGWYATDSEGELIFSADCIFILLTQELEYEQVSPKVFFESVKESSNFHLEDSILASIKLDDDGNISVVKELYTP